MLCVLRSLECISGIGARVWRGPYFDLVLFRSSLVAVPLGAGRARSETMLPRVSSPAYKGTSRLFL